MSSHKFRNVQGKVIGVRLSDAQIEILTKLAAAEGMSAGAYAKRVLAGRLDFMGRYSAMRTGQR